MEAPLRPARPRRFLAWWLGSVVLLALGGLPLLNWMLLGWPQAPDVAWVTGLWERKLALAQAAPPGPRLLLVGGSAGHFSLDAELLEARLGLPVYNLCSHAGLGLHFLLENAREAARPGDTILLYLEDAHYRGNSLPELAQHMIWTSMPRRLARLPLNTLVEILYQVPFEEYGRGWERRNQAMSANAAMPLSGTMYSVFELGPRGDPRSDLPVKALPAVAPRKLERQVDAASARDLRALAEWARCHGIHLVAAAPGSQLAPGSLPVQQQRLALQRNFQASLGVPFLETPSTTELPPELLLDTRYHASAAGRRIVTEALAGPLARYFGRVLPSPVEATLLVTARRSDPGHDLILAREGPARCKLLTPVATPEGLSMTPAQVLEAVGAGERFVFTEPEVKALLDQAGVPSQIASRGTSTLAEWVQAYRNHVFCLVADGEPSPAAWASTVPEPFAKFLAAPEAAKVAILGTGRYRQVRRWKLHEPASLHETERAPWQAGWAFPADLVLQAGPASEKHPFPLMVGRLPLAQRRAAGVLVAVLDPAQGRIVRQGEFQAEKLIEWELWETSAAVPAHVVP